MFTLYLIEFILYIILIRKDPQFWNQTNATICYIFACVVINTLIRYHSIWPLVKGVLKGALLWIIVVILAIVAVVLFV